MFELWTLDFEMWTCSYNLQIAISVFDIVKFEKNIYKEYMQKKIPGSPGCAGLTRFDSKPGQPV